MYQHTFICKKVKDLKAYEVSLSQSSYNVGKRGEFREFQMTEKVDISLCKCLCNALNPLSTYVVSENKSDENQKWTNENFFFFPLLLNRY